MNAFRSSVFLLVSDSARLFVPLLAALALALLVFAPAVPAQAAPFGYGVLLQEDVLPGIEPDPAGVALLLTLSTQVAAIVEAAKRLYIKPVADRNKWSENHYVGILTALGVLVGIGSAFMAGPSADLLRMLGITFLPPAIGILMSGILISFGQVGVHWGVDALRDLVILLRAYSTKLMSESDAISTQGTATTSTPAAIVETPAALIIGTPEHDAYLERFANRLFVLWNNSSGSTGSAPDPVPRSPAPSLN
jgi:hypothetical protein